MQFTINVNQQKALEWGLNSQQALLFAFVYEVPSWAQSLKTDEGVFYVLSKAKIVEELPILTDKPDTAYRLLKQLDEAGVIELNHTSKVTLVRLTDKGKTWNRKRDGSEKYPTSKADEGRKKIRATSEKSPSKVGKKSEPGSEKSPTNQGTSNQDTNQVTNQVLPAASGSVVADVPRVEIPADMPGPKDQNAKTFKAWANYAFAYRKRYSVWPAWNATVAGQLGKLIDRLGADVAPRVAAFYLGVNDSRLINDCHPVGMLLAKAEGYMTQWQTGRQMNATTARQIEQTQANINAAQAASEAILSREGKRNAFL